LRRSVYSVSCPGLAVNVLSNSKT